MPTPVPEGYEALGYVGFTDKGDYSISATYMKNDLVHYKNDIWKCIANNTSGATPGTSTAKWEIFVSGENIIYAARANFPATGNSNKFYIDNTVTPRIIYTWDDTQKDYIITGGSGGGDIDISNENIAFTEPSTYTKPVSGHPLKEFAGRAVKGLSVLFTYVGTLSSLKTTAKSNLVAAINELFDNKFDKSKIIASTNITEPGYAMDGKTVSEEFAKLNSNSGNGGTILWENPNPTVAFAAQTITLTSADFDCYEIFARRSATNPITLSQKSLINCGTYIMSMDSSFKVYARQFVWSAPNKLQVGATIYEGISNQNDVLVPAKIVGYKF